LTIFDPKVSYTDLSKNRPHKKHCAWAPTPPWRKYKIYRFFAFFWVLGAFNRAGKTVSKIGIYSKPPPKSEIYRLLLKIGGQILSHHHFIDRDPWFKNRLPAIE
jgi:hypothetical protein